MKYLQKPDSVQVGLGVSPNKCDIAIVSIDYAGTPGLLNELVLQEYGYSINDLPNQQQLEFGFRMITDNRRKPILFVVTVSGRSTAENIEDNLFRTLEEFRGWMIGKNIWLPLMGTGSGGLAFKESYEITISVINRFTKEYPIETSFLISIPDNLEGKELIDQVDFINNNIDLLVKSFKNKFYLAGSIWSGDEQLSRFLEKGFWEKGQDDDSYRDVINQVQVGDIIIIKSTYASNGISYLRVKAFGVVVANPKNGRSFFVNWTIKDKQFDIENKGYYRNTINEASLDDAVIILSRVDTDRVAVLFHPSDSSRGKERIAGLISDSDIGVDYLDIAKDVRAFARVISAKSFEPPLAVALFGKWGSGKSFFMRKLKAQIINLSSNDKNGVYCEGVAQIHFNAWSYMDSNLWASIVTKIFEELNEYISENRKDDIEKKEIEKQLVDKLSITKDEIGFLETRKDIIESQISSFKEKSRLSKIKLDEKIKELKLNSAWKVIKKIDDEFDAREKFLQALNTNDSYIKTEVELRKIIPEEYWINPGKMHQIIKSKYIFFEEFFRKDKSWINISFLVLILLIILLMPGIIALFSVTISKINFIIPQASLSLLIAGAAIVKRIRSVCNGLKPLISAFWNIKVSYEEQIEKALSAHMQEEKALNLEIAKGKAEILLIEEQIQKAETIRVDLEYRINNAFATEALYSFIDRRSKSEDYKKHLGIISVIRRDFEILNSLFIGHNEEAEKIKSAAEFKSKFKKPLERIVLYIDDLDRCPEENVVQVLEAVNLLMAFPLFVVVVGVDSRWVKNALMKRHALQFAASSYESSNKFNNLESIEVSSYLEKIFQVPFHLKEAEDNSVKDMIAKLTQNKVSIAKAVKSSSPKNTIDNEDIISPNDGDIFPTDIKEISLVEGSDIAIIDSGVEGYVDVPEALIIEDIETALMQDMSVIIGNNPRAIKRYVNIYRIIKAHEEFNYEINATNQELIAILFLLALPLGEFRKLVPSLESFIRDENNYSKQLSSYLQPVHQIQDFAALKHKLDVLLSVKKSFVTLQSTTISTVGKHSEFIKRFTFNSI